MVTVSEGARERLAHILLNEDNLTLEEIISQVNSDPEFRAILHELAEGLLTPERYEDVAGKLGIRAKMIRIGGDSILLEFHPGGCTARYCGLHQFVERPDAATALRDLVDVCKGYVNWLYQLKADGRHGENLEFEIAMIEKHGGKDAWESIFSNEVEEWIATNPQV